MQRKRVAVVLSQAGSTYQKNLLHGLLDEAFKKDLDVCVFSTFIKDGIQYAYRLGEANIFNLLNPEKFDGVMIVPDTIKFPDAAERLASECIRLELPAVTIDYQIDGIPCIWGSDSDDVERLVDHLIDVHGCKTIDLISGVKDHPHSLSREAGYKRSLEKHGIPVDAKRIHYADFGREKCAEIADDILTSGRPLPQGIAGVCDSSAEAMAEELLLRGCSVPDDIRIVGYDTNVETPEYIGNVTTMYRNSGQTGRRAVRYLYDLLCGKAPSDKSEAEPCANGIITSESCGCGRENKKPNYSINNDIGGLSLLAGSFYSDYNFMLEDLIANDNYEEFFWNLNWYTCYLNSPDGVYTFTCDEWMTESEDDTDYRTVGYPEKMTMIHSLENGEASVDPTRTIDRSLMLPRLYEDCEKPSVYYFTPLHFNDRCFGYTVLHYIGRPVVFNPEFASWMRNADNAFESMRRRLKMKNLYESKERLKTFSVTDSLTGIYNRNGFNSIAVDMFKNAHDSGEGLFMLVGDMNDLKMINDTYGHIEGDESIKTAAAAMVKACGKNEKCFRIGGDEFVVIGAGDYTQEEIASRLQRVEEHIADYNSKSDKPYKLSISLGYVCAPAEGFDRIEDALSVADEKMFINKQAFKKRKR